jgi:hypothetical protein
VIGIEAFGKRSPEAERLFGSLGAAMLSLAQARASTRRGSAPFRVREC